MYPMVRPPPPHDSTLMAASLWEGLDQAQSLRKQKESFSVRSGEASSFWTATSHVERHLGVVSGGVLKRIHRETSISSL